MTGVITVSAATAAYAAEPLKPSARVSGAGQTPETTQAQVLEARAADTIRHAQMMNVVGPPAIAVFFLTAGERQRVLQQATYREAEEAYFFGRDEVEETQERSGENSDQPAEDENGEEFREQQDEILALPAPDGLS
jgi:hypothetical protein